MSAGASVLNSVYGVTLQLRSRRYICPCNRRFPCCLTARRTRAELITGASPPGKIETLLQRMSKQVATARVFYSLSSSTRSAPTFSNRGDTILPPFCRSAFAAALESLSVPTHFVPMGEADGVVVALADKCGGYVLGRDTDFVILSAGCERLRGYAPLDMMDWTDSAPLDDAPGADFQTVAGKRPRSGRSRLLPPAGAGNPTLVLATYSTSALCRRLRLDAPLLPLLSSLVGNDYTPAWAGEVLFPRMRPGDRIDRAARVLADLRPSVVAAEDLVRRAVRKLWVRPFIDDTDLNELVDSIIDATIQYVLPAPPCCDVLPFCGDLDDGCRTATGSRATSRATTPGPGEHGNAVHSEAAIAYAAMQRKGRLSALTSAYLYPDRVHLWPALEDPSKQSNRAAEAAGRARLAAYTIMDTAVGLRFPPASDEMRDEMRQDEEASFLLGVEQPIEELEERPRVVTEYMRQGSSSRMVTKRAVLPPRDEAAPGADAFGNDEEEEHAENHRGTKETEAMEAMDTRPQDSGVQTNGGHGATATCLWPLPERQRLYLHYLGADTPSILAMPARLHPLLGAVRLVLASGADWTKAELEAVLRGAIGSLAAWDAAAASSSSELQSSFKAPSSPSTPSGLERVLSNASSVPSASFEFDAGSIIAPELTSRNAHIVAALTSALQDASFLAQALLLPDTHTSPHVWICGSALHSLLAGRDPPPGAGWVWNAGCRSRWRKAVAAVLDGVSVSSAPSPGEKKKAKKKNKGKSRKEKQNGETMAKNGATNRFDLLVGM